MNTVLRFYSVRNCVINKQWFQQTSVLLLSRASLSKEEFTILSNCRFGEEWVETNPDSTTCE